MTEPLRVIFTSRENTGILGGVRLTATQRFQRRLEDLLAERKAHGDPAPKGTLASYCGKEAQSWVSNMLSEVRATQPSLEDLENISDFFQVSISSLFRPTRFREELLADEQRLVLAFRSVPDVIQTHFLAMLEAASLNANLLVGKRLRELKGRSITTGLDDAPTAPSSELARIRGILTQLSIDLAAALASLADHQSSPSAAHPPSKSRKVGA